MATKKVNYYYDFIICLLPKLKQESTIMTSSLFAKNIEAWIYYYMLTTKLEAKVYYKFFIRLLRKVKQKSTIMTSLQDYYKK